MLQNKIGVVTGSRAEFGILNKLIKLIDDSDQLDLLLYVTGTHLSPEFGYTIEDIKSEYESKIIEIEVLMSSDTTQSVGKSISIGILGFIEQFSNTKPSYVVLLGDRFEIFAAGIAAVHCNIKVAHIHGGDLGKAIFDNLYRNTLSILSEIHFAATLKSLIRILNFGVNPDNVYLVGSPTQDQIINADFSNKEDLSNELKIGLDKKWITVVYHPSESLQITEKEFSNLLIAIKECSKVHDFHTVVIYPNADSGGRRIINLINEIEGDSRFSVVKNLTRNRYLSLLKHSYLLIGNSSSGIIEGPALNLPVINLGRRQEDREQGENVLNITTFESEDLKIKLHELFTDNNYYKSFKDGFNPYGDGKSSERIFQLIQADLGKDSKDIITSGKLYNNEQIVQRLRKINSVDIEKIENLSINFNTILSLNKEES